MHDDALATTIEAALRSHALSIDEVARRYPGPAGLVRRILGVLPRVVGYFEICPPTLVTYNVSVPALLDVPKCDIGLGISPELRALVAHVASRSFGCQYCMAHTAIMGTLVRGPLHNAQISGRVIEARDPGKLRPSEQAAVAFAQAIAQVPSGVTPALMTRLGEHYPPNHVEAIVLVTVMLGYLCRFMDSLGAPLETAIHDAVSEPLGDAGWTAGKHADAEVTRQDREEGHTALSRASRLGLAREIPQAILYERAALAQIPTASQEQDALLGRTLGFVPQQLSNVRRAGARRVLAHWWVKRLATARVDVDAGVKHRMGWVLARVATNDALAAQFAFLAHRAGVSTRQLAQDERPAASPDRSKAGAAVALAHGTAKTSARVASALIEQLVATHTPASIVELLEQVSIVCGLQRLAAAFPATRYEPEVAAFLGAQGAALGLPAEPRHVADP